MELELKKTSLDRVIKDAIDELKIKAKEKGIYLRFKKPKKPLAEILIDKDKIRQVLLNVVDNAIKYTQKGGITINVKYQTSNIKIIIKDTGEGMTKEELLKMFESFSRGMAGTRLYTEGAGLGLYVARRFMEMHKGRIWAESEGKEKGSTFYIELPIK